MCGGGRTGLDEVGHLVDGVEVVAVLVVAVREEVAAVVPGDHVPAMATEGRRSTRREDAGDEVLHVQGSDESEVHAGA